MYRILDCRWLASPSPARVSLYGTTITIPSGEFDLIRAAAKAALDASPTSLASSSSSRLASRSPLPTASELAAAGHKIMTKMSIFTPTSVDLDSVALSSISTSQWTGYDVVLTRGADYGPVLHYQQTTPDPTSDQNDGQSSKISKGVIAGIAVGTAIGVCICIAAVGLLIWSNKGKKEDADQEKGLEEPPGSVQDARSGSHDIGSMLSKSKCEGSSNPPSGLDSGSVVGKSSNGSDPTPASQENLQPLPQKWQIQVRCPGWMDAPTVICAVCEQHGRLQLTGFILCCANSSQASRLHMLICTTPYLLCIYVFIITAIKWAARSPSDVPVLAGSLEACHCTHCDCGSA